MTEPLYTAQQINLPPQLPEILKQFTKAAIKTQPTDIILWASQLARPSILVLKRRYFDALANNRPPPVKARVALHPTEIRPTSASSMCLGTSRLHLPETAISVEQLEGLRAAVCAFSPFCRLNFQLLNHANEEGHVSLADVTAACTELGIPSTIVADIIKYENLCLRL